jgi:serine/threonine protein kinase
VQSIGIDDEDGLPVRTCRPGDILTADPVYGDLRAIELLGTGHRCETWLVWSTRLWHPAVLKIARPHQVDHPRARRTLEREVAALAGRPVHPVLPRLLADGAGSRAPYLLIEYVDGLTLADEIDENGPLDPAETALLGCELLSAVAALHLRGLAHLDVKTENVMLRDGRPMLVDFGSARRIGSPQPPGQPVGTPGYAAPELDACAPVSVAMDLFGVGAVLAEALTGSPFPDRPALPPSPVGVVVGRLVSEDPASRGTIAEALLALAPQCGSDARPWPEWADARLRVGTGPSATRASYLPAWR